MHVILIARRDYTVSKVCLIMTSGQSSKVKGSKVKVFQSAFFTDLLIFTFASTYGHYKTWTGDCRLGMKHRLTGSR